MKKSIDVKKKKRFNSFLVPSPQKINTVPIFMLKSERLVLEPAVSHVILKTQRNIS